MKKTYEKPSIVRKGKLSAITSGGVSVPTNGNAPA